MRRLAILLVLITCGVLAPAGAAHADLNDDAAWTLGDCQWQTPNTVDVIQTITLNESNGYTAAFGFPANVWWGDAFEIVATGTVNDGGWPTSSNWTADGSSSTAPSGGHWPVAGAPKYGLVGLWNSTGAGFFIGAHRGCWSTSAAAAGIGPQTTKTFLRLAMNDEYVLDNHGSWTVTVRQWFRQGT